MICRVAFHDEMPGPITEGGAERFRAWIKTMPGFVAGWHAQDPATGRAVSFTVWETEAHLDALKEQVPPGGPVGMKPTRMETFPVALPF